MSDERELLFEEDEDFINENHLHSFAKALVWEEDEDTPDRTRSIKREASIIDEVDANETSFVYAKRPDLISSKSDWYPVNTITSPKKSRLRKGKDYESKTLRNEFRSSTTYAMLRWPMLFFIIIWIVFLCLIYVIIRGYVALLEYLFTWVGERKRLRDKLRASKTYDEWIKNAIELDKYLNLDKWSENPRFSYYDYKTIKLTISRLKALREQNNDKELMVFLQGCLKKNFAGIENRQLYSHRYYGTKKLVEEYISEVVQCVEKVTDSEDITFESKREFFRIVLKNYGKTALCLSGGAFFAYTHFGIVKALLDNDLLPSIISGTSGGGLVAALACTRTNEELKKLLVPQLARKITACEEPWYIWLPRLWKTGARFDSVTWARKANFFTRGSMSFQEAYKRTGRKLNISTVPSDPHSPVILCNNITSPHCIIWSSLLASAAIPGILNPVVLMMKNPNNSEVVSFSLGSKWRDGSLRTDIPIDALNTYYNVNFSIVSQVNPHISLFFYAPKGTVGRPVAANSRRTRKEKYASFRGGFVATALEQLLKLEITKWLQMIKSLDLLPLFLEQDWLNIWLQKFSGTITIWPRFKLKDFMYILSDPSEDKLAQMIEKGEKSMFPRLLFIKHRLSIEKAIERGRTKTKYQQPNHDIKDYNEKLPTDFDANISEPTSDSDTNSIISLDGNYNNENIPYDPSSSSDDEFIEDNTEESNGGYSSSMFSSFFGKGEKHRRNTIF